MDIMIDTDIWCFSVKKPIREKFSSIEHFNRAINIHKKAKKIIKDALLKDTIYMSIHQLAEIFHVLAYRGTKMPLQQAMEYIRALIDAEEIIKVNVSWFDFLEAIQLSSTAKIHIWDFLCFVPIKKYIKVIYTSDRHFTHKIFKKFDITIINPFNSWMPL